MKTLQNVTVFPLKHGRFGWIDGGIYQDGGSRIRDWPVLGSSRAHKLVAKRRKPDVQNALLIDEGIFGGVWFYHFGHFLTETLPNLAMVLKEQDTGEDCPIYFQSLYDGSIAAENFPGYVETFVKRLGIDPARFRLINTPVVFQTLKFPTPPYARKYRLSDPVPEALDSGLKLTKDTGAGRKIYFSRGALAAKSRSPIDEQVPEAFFADHGFEIVYPEKLSVDAQLDLVGSTRVLAGFNGSALHWSLYAGNIAHVVELGWKLGLQRGICDVRGQKLTSLPGAGFSRVRGRPHRKLPLEYLEKNLRKVLQAA